MQLLFLNSRFGPACFGQGKRRAARHPLPFSQKYCGVDPWVKDYITPLANSPSRPMQSDNSVTHGPCRATGVPAEAFIVFPGPSGHPNHPVPHWIWSNLSSGPSYLVGSKWAFLHNVEFSDAIAFRSLRSPENRHYVITHCQFSG